MPNDFLITFFVGEIAVLFRIICLIGTKGYKKGGTGSSVGFLILDVAWLFLKLDLWHLAHLLATRRDTMVAVQIDPSSGV